MHQRRVCSVGSFAPTDHPSSIEDIAEVIALSCVDDIHHKTAIQFESAKAHRREIGSRIEKTAIRLLDKQRTLAISERNNHRASVGFREARSTKRFNHATQTIAKETLAAIVRSRQLHIENACRVVNLLHRDFDDAFPFAHDFSVT